MRVQIIGKRSRNPAPRRGVTSRTTRLWSRFRTTRHVLRVVKFGIKTGQVARKSFDRRILLAQPFGRVTDSAERAARRTELRLVTTDARFVSG